MCRDRARRSAGARDHPARSSPFLSIDHRWPLRVGVEANVVHLGYLLIGTRTGHEEDAHDRDGDYAQVERETRMVDVPHIELEPPAERNVLAPSDLSPAGDTGTH